MISSTSNPQVKRLAQLQKKSKARNEEKVFIVEGIRMFVEVPRERVEKVYVSESLYNKKKQELKWEEFPLEILSDSVFKHVSDTQTPQGILCIVKQKKYDLDILLNLPKSDIFCTSACIAFWSKYDLDHLDDVVLNFLATSGYNTFVIAPKISIL